MRKRLSHLPEAGITRHAVDLAPVLRDGETVAGVRAVLDRDDGLRVSTASPDARTVVLELFGGPAQCEYALDLLIETTDGDLLTAPYWVYTGPVKADGAEAWRILRHSDALAEPPPPLPPPPPPKDWQIVTDEDGTVRAVGADLILTVEPSTRAKKPKPGRIWKRNFVKYRIKGGPQEHIRVLCGELDGVRVYWLDGQILMTRREFDL